MYLIEQKLFHMKLLSYIVTIIVVLVSFGASAQSKTQQTFPKKFGVFIKTPYAKLRWTHSPDASEQLFTRLQCQTPLMSQKRM